MNDLKIFLKTSVDEPSLTVANTMNRIGDMGLSPIRYLWNGRTFKIEENSVEMDPSFDKKGDCFCLQMIKTALAIALLLPGLVLSLVKAASYLSSAVRDNHMLVKEYITLTGTFEPVNREIGSSSKPIKTYQELQAALEAELENETDQETGALIIYGDGNLTINEDPGILENYNPYKLILIGARLVHQRSVAGRLDDAMQRTGEWNLSPYRIASPGNSSNSYEGQASANTLKEALKAPLTRIDEYTFYHEVYTLPLSEAAK